jgi:hypothetical protein
MCENTALTDTMPFVDLSQYFHLCSMVHRVTIAHRLTAIGWCGGGVGFHRTLPVTGYELNIA